MKKVLLGVYLKGNFLNKLLIIIITFLVLLLLGGGATAYILLSSSEEEPHQKKENVDNDLTSIGTIIPLDPFILNLFGGNRAYLKTEISLEYSESETILTEVETKKPVIRDAIIKTLSTMSPDELFTEKGKEKAKQKIKEELDSYISEKVKNVYFTEFVIQS